MLPDNLHIVWWWRNQIFSLCDHHRFILFHSNLCLENMIWFSLTLWFGQCIWLQPAPVTSRLVYTIVCISKYPIEFVKKKKLSPTTARKISMLMERLRQTNHWLQSAQFVLTWPALYLMCTHFLVSQGLVITVRILSIIVTSTIISEKISLSWHDMPRLWKGNDIKRDV